MRAREKKEMKPLLLKLGVALALSFAGFLCSRLRIRRVRPSLPPPPSAAPQSSDVDSMGGRVWKEDEVHASHTRRPSTSSEIESVPVEKHQEMCGDKDRLLSPEFNVHAKDVNISASHTLISPNKGLETVKVDVGSPKPIRTVEPDGYEQEVNRLTSMVRILRERERNLEVQLLEYYGLKEQEKTVMELENRLKISNMEAKLLSLKIDSLRADNCRLEAQVADHAKVVAELESAKGKIKLLKRKLRYEAEQNREHIMTLQERVANLREQEQKASSSDPDIQSKMQRIMDLENEVEELRSSNLKLQLENAELGQRLESTQILATSALENSEVTELMVVSDQLKQENETMAKEIEKLQADRYGDVEELVYLRWLNACLRFELRNFQPPSGKTARDLSRQLSPKSEEKAKKLILEYARTEGLGESASNFIADFDSDQWSTSQTSYLAGFDSSDDSPVDPLSAQKTRSSSKHKLMKKLKKLITGKDGKDGKDTGKEDQDSDHSSLCSSSTLPIDHAHSDRFATPDIHEKQVNIDIGSSGRYKRYDPRRRGSVDFEHGIDTESVSGKSDLVKYAEALKGSESEGRRLRRRSASYSSF